MKKKWRWPLAGFVLGALVGATVLTVNVVGANSPAPVAVSRRRVRRDPAHARAARASGQTGRALVRRRLRRAEGRAGVALLSVGLGLRAPRRRFDVHQAAARTRALMDCCPRRSRRANGRAGFDYYAVVDDGAAGRRRCPRPGPRLRSTCGRSTTGRRSTSAPRTSGIRGRRPRSSGASRGAVATPRSGSTAVASSRVSARLRSTSHPTAPSSCSTRSTAGSSCCDAGLGPFTCRSSSPGGEGDLAVGGDGTIYVLDSSAKPLVRAFTAAGALDRRHAVGGADRGHDSRRSERPARPLLPVGDVVADRGRVVRRSRPRGSSRRRSRLGARVVASGSSSMHRRPR